MTLAMRRFLVGVKNWFIEYIQIMIFCTVVWAGFQLLVALWAADYFSIKDDIIKPLFIVLALIGLKQFFSNNKS